MTEAQRAIYGQRAADYGDVTENFEHTADLISAYLGVEVTALDFANIMIIVKMSRVRNTKYHHDSYVDIAGYAACAQRVYEGEPATGPEKSPFYHYVEQFARTGSKTAEPVWKDGLDEFPEGVPVWDAEDWEAGYGGDPWLGEGPGGPAYAKYGPFTDTRPPQVETGIEDA